MRTNRQSLALVSILSICICVAAAPALAQGARKKAEQLEQAGDLKGAVTQYTAVLQKVPAGSARDKKLREKVIDLVLKLNPKPAVSEEAIRHGVAGEALAKAAHNDAGRTQAAKEYRIALKLAPWWADAYLDYGLLEEAMHHPTEAIWAYNFYLRAAPNARDAEQVRRRIYAQEALAKEATQQRTQEAENRKNCNSSSPDISIRGCTAVVEASGETSAILALAFNNRGGAYYHEGRYNSAIEDYDQAIRLKPDFANAFANRCAVYGTEAQYDRAIQDCDEAIRLDPNFAEAFSIRCHTYLLKSQYDRAIQDCDEAIRLKPDFALAYAHRCAAYVYKGQYDRGIQDCDEAIRLKSDFALAYTNRCFAYFDKGQYDRAIQDCDEAIRLKPDFALAYNNRCATYSRKGQYDRAIQDCDEAIQLKPDYGLAFYNRGVAKLKMGDGAGNADIATARRLSPNIGR